MEALDRIRAWFRRSLTPRPAPQHLGSGATFIRALPSKPWLLRLKEYLLG